jgi:hypothetical protein
VFTSLDKLLSGGYSLPVSFWGFWLGGSLVALVAGWLGAITLVYLLGTPKLSIQLLTVIVVGYVIATSVGVWRSANSYSGKRYWAYAAKGLVLLNAVADLADTIRHWDTLVAFTLS